MRCESCAVEDCNLIISHLCEPWAIEPKIYAAELEDLKSALRQNRRRKQQREDRPVEYCVVERIWPREIIYLYSNSSLMSGVPTLEFVHTTPNGDYVYIDAKDVERVAKELRGIAYRCERDDDLVNGTVSY